MKYIKQFAVILIITFIGEMLNGLIPLPIPASVYGLVLLYICLLTGLIKLSAVEDAGKFLIEIMPIMFIPAGVGLIESWDVLKPICIPFITITIISTIAVMSTSGVVVQWVMRHKKGSVHKK